MIKTMFNRISRVMPSALRQPTGFTFIRYECKASSGDEFNKKYVDILKSENCDGWMIRKCMNDLVGMDLVPDPVIVIEALKACRRVNDFALAMRWMEAVRDKCVDSYTYCYILESTRETLNELGVPTPEEIGYDKPELALKSVHDM